MITFILPGFSLKNKEWLEECAKQLEVEGTIRPIYWEHWDDPQNKFKAKEKAKLIARHTKGEKFNIVAKSIGSLVASYIINEIPDQIEKVIICGIPTNDISDQDNEIIKKALSSVSKGKLICYQNSEDPHGTYSQIRGLLSDKIEVISKDRADHHYPYYKDFNKFLEG